MRFKRFAPSVLLAGTLVLWFLPIVDIFTGLDFFKFVLLFWSKDVRPLAHGVYLVVVLYPFCLLVGALVAVLASPSARRAVVVGASALLPMIGLTALYLQMLFEDRSSIQEFTFGFYLSHAAMSACIVLCVREYGRRS